MIFACAILHGTQASPGLRAPPRSPRVAPGDTPERADGVTITRVFRLEAGGGLQGGISYIAAVCRGWCARCVWGFRAGTAVVL